MAFAQSLPAPTLYSAIASAEPLTPIMRYKATQNVRRAWEEVPLPEGLCVMGDSVCALNPIYGQVSAPLQQVSCASRLQCGSVTSGSTRCFHGEVVNH